MNDDWVNYREGYTVGFAEGENYGFECGIEQGSVEARCSDRSHERLWRAGHTAGRADAKYERITDGMDRLPIQLFDNDAQVPVRAHSGDAGLDLHTLTGAELPAQGGRAMLRTGVAVAIPHGYAGFIHPRSGLAIKHGVTIPNAPGTVDAGYRGEIQVGLVNLDPQRDATIVAGDRIAQLIIQPVVLPEPVVFGSLDVETSRGANGFGSTGNV